MLPSTPSVITDLLRTRGPLDETALLDLARAGGAPHLSASQLEGLLHPGDELPEVICLLDGRHAHVEQLLLDRVLTYRLTDFDIAYDVVPFDGDLRALIPLIDTGSELMEVSGREVTLTEDIEDERWHTLAAAIDEHEIDTVSALSSAPHAQLYAPAESEFDIEQMIALPPGTLGDFEPGDLLGIRVTDAGLVLDTVTPGAPPDDLSARIRTVRDAQERRPESRSTARAPERDSTSDEVPMPVDIGLLVLALMGSDPELFRDPLPPVTELVSKEGFVILDSAVAEPDVDPRRWALTNRTLEVMSDHDLPVAAALSVAHIAPWVWWSVDVLAAGDLEDGDLKAGDLEGEHPNAGPEEAGDVPDVTVAPPLPDDPEGIAGLTAHLSDPEVAEALLAEALGVDPEPAPVLGALVETWEPHATRKARVGLRWIRSRCAERLGLVAEAEEHLQVARTFDDDWPPVLRDLARYASDRGDATAAISLLRRAGVSDDDPDLEFLRGLASPPRAGLGRNHPCWCGSGRKYKLCHLGKEELPLPLRARWLYRKAFQYIDAGPYRYLMLDLAERRARYDDGPMALLDALTDPLVIDAALFTGGAGLDFLEQRGHLLPVDERALLEQWLLQDHSVYEVTQVRVGQGFTVRDIRTGDVVEVTERAGSRQLRKGQRLLMRLLPVGEEWRIFSGIAVLPMAMEQAAMELCDELADGLAGSQELVGFATSRFAPPTLQTTDGEPMVQCTAEYRVDDRAAVEEALATMFGGHEDGEFAWLSDDSDHATVFGHLTLGVHGLTVGTMNEKRWSQLRDMLDEVEGLHFVNVTRISAAELMQQAVERRDAGNDDGPGAGGFGALGGMEDPVDSPELQAVMDDYARTHEKRWLDEPIPALDGLTPRAAAEDPTRRDEVIRLLDGYDAHPGRGLMDTDRLRAALDL